MPIYTYTCDSCSHQFESVQKMDTETSSCPECGQESQRTVSKPAKFVWGKSGGWN